MMIYMKDISKNYRGVKILQDINLTLSTNPGIVAFIGANGSGKSTVLRLISGIYVPIKGSIFYTSDAVSKKGDKKQRLLDKFIYISSSERILNLLWSSIFVTPPPNLSQ